MSTYLNRTLTWQKSNNKASQLKGPLTSFYGQLSDCKLHIYLYSKYIWSSSRSIKRPKCLKVQWQLGDLHDNWLSKLHLLRRSARCYWKLWEEALKKSGHWVSFQGTKFMTFLCNADSDIHINAYTKANIHFTTETTRNYSQRFLKN